MRLWRLARFTVLSLAVLALLPLSRAASAGEPEAGLSARDILDRMASVYAGCRTYQDNGSVRTRYNSKAVESESGLAFATAFVRPERFRFQYESSPRERYLLSAEGDTVKTWWSVNPRVERWKSLGMALATAGGVSKLSSHFIPTLLLPDRTEGRRLTDMTDLKRLEDASLDGTGCFRIQGVFGSDQSERKLTVWIDRDRFLVLRIDSHNFLDTPGGLLEVASTHLYQPVLDGIVPEERLAFDPPAGARMAAPEDRH